MACGYHASDPVVMDKTLSMAREAGIRVGAHPGYPDLMGFGRRNMNVTPQEAKAYTLYQLGALDALQGAWSENAACKTTRSFLQYGGERL